MTESQLADLIRAAIEEFEASVEDPAVRQTDTFEEAGVMAGNPGLLVRTVDGREFQITVVRSR